MLQSEYTTTVKRHETCVRDRGLEGCHQCKHTIWSAQPCELSYELASHDVATLARRIAELHERYDAVQCRDGAHERESQKDLEAELTKHYGYDVTLAEFIAHAEAYVRRLKERVATREPQHHPGRLPVPG